jgi:hypothetical protein
MKSIRSGGTDSRVAVFWYQRVDGFVGRERDEPLQATECGIDRVTLVERLEHVRVGGRSRGTGLRRERAGPQRRERRAVRVVLRLHKE